jgi:hypothetical protein
LGHYPQDVGKSMRFNIIKPLAFAMKRLQRKAMDTAKREPNVLAKEDVIWGYRLFLDREPENQLVVKEKLATVRGTKELRNNFMLSPEFSVKNPDLAPFIDTNIVMKELDEKLRLFVDISDHVIGWGIIRESTSYVNLTLSGEQ